MIRGAGQAFKFTTSFDFKDIDNIEAVWSQPHNVGTAEAPMPIIKYYNRELREIEDEYAVRNDGFAPVDGVPKSFVTVLSAEETLRFNEKYKGCVQVTVFSNTSTLPEKSKIEYFTVYPTMSNEVFGELPPSDPELVRILDAGKII